MSWYRPLGEYFLKLTIAVDWLFLFSYLPNFSKRQEACLTIVDEELT